MNDFKSITVSREDLVKVLEVFDTGEFVHFGLEIDSIEGDQILWVDNGKFGDDRAYIRINNPYKKQNL